ncbi:MAG: DNA repair protein RecO [Peptococcaceae bacterium]
MEFLREIIKTQAVILRARNYSEADQLLTLFTEKLGKVTAIVKGVKKPKSKLRGGVQVFSHTNVNLYLGKSLATLTQAEVVNTFAPLREDLLRMSYAAYLSELMDALMPEAEQDSKLFSLFLLGLHLLAVEEPWLAAKVMEIRLMSALGYQLQLENCVHCGAKVKSNYLAPGTGGLVCDSCIREEKLTDLMKISGETNVLMRQLLDMELTKVGRLKFSNNARTEMEGILDTHIINCVGRKLKSKEFLAALT